MLAKCIWEDESCNKAGVEGLKNKPRTGRPSELSEKSIYNIKTILKESNQGWTTKQVEEMIIEKSGIKYHHTHIYRILRKWGFKQKVPRKVHVNTASKEEKMEFKKDRTNTCGCSKPLPTTTTAAAAAA